MADFRRVVTALAVVVLLMGVASTASAQVSGPAFSCTASAAVPPLLRAEGLTELTGDIVLNCTGGTAIAPGTELTALNLANITVFLGNTTVTSRILNTSTSASEALLLIDEPNTALSGFAPFSICGTPTTGCSPYVAGATPNTYQGIVSGNSVTFIGIPIVPPGSTGTRIFRITNVRANASTVGAGPAGTPGQVQAFVSISGSTSIPINNPTQVVGFVQNGLAFSVRRATDVTLNIAGAGLSFAQCSDIGRATPRAVLTYTEGFATAFKTRGDTSQTTPGAVYNTESGLVLSTITGGTITTTTAGLADFGTRVRATFNNIPTGVNVWVSTTNYPSPASTAGSTAVLVGSETGPQAPVTATVQLNPLSGTTLVNAAPVAISGGTGSAVWEVTASSPLITETLGFLLYFSATANPGNNTPAAGVTGTVSGSFAPAPPAIDATAAARASATLPIPRFIDSGTPRNLIVINVCRTNLLFPFVTNQAGFDTGLAISNTSQDPFGTATQAGTCTLNFYGANAPAAITSSSVAAGTTYTALASSSAPNFQGYVIAVCNFQMAHGFAFVSDLGARNLAMGYLALVMADPARSFPATGEALDQ